MTILFPGVQESTVPANTSKNSSVAALASAATPQNVATTSITYLTGSKVPVPNGGFTLNSKFEAEIEVTKTGAGTAAATIAVLAGPAGDVTDTVIATFAKPAGTGTAADAAMKIKTFIAGQFATSQVPYLTNSTLSIINSLATQGVVALASYVTSELTTLSTTQVAALAAANYIGVAVTLGASDNYTFNQVEAALSGTSTGAPNQ